MGHQSSSTTVVVIGDQAPRAIRSVEGLSNVDAASLAGAPEEEAVHWTRRAHATYLVHDWDPLGHVANSWVEFFEDESTFEVLELEIDRTVSALGSGSIAVPDYYVVVEPEALERTWKHWWLGVLPGASPTRVIPWTNPDESLAKLLRRLPTGRPWPESGPWLRGLRTAVPDRVGLPGVA